MRAPERNLTSFEARRQVAPAPPPSDFIYVSQSDLPAVLRKLWRRKKMIAVTTCGLLAIAGGLGLVLNDRYGAVAQVRIGLPQPHIAQMDSVVSAVAPDPETMETEAQAAQSRRIAAAAVRRLGLDQDPEFNFDLRPYPLWSKVTNGIWRVLTLDFLRHSSPPPEADTGNGAKADAYDPEQEVVDHLRSRLDVTQEGRSHILDIEVQSENPFKAARIANTVADLYIESRLERRAHQNQATGTWLDQQIDKLRTRLDNDERQVEDYRRQHGLYETKSATVTEQQLGELNTQLILAQSEKASAEAKLADARRLLKSKSTDTVPAVLGSPTIIALKQQEAEIERHAAELASTYGPKHPQLKNVLAQKRDIQRKIAAEVGLVVQGLRNEANTASARYNALRRNLEEVKTNTGRANSDSVKLHELERQADASRALFQTFLLRSQETQAQQNFIGADGEVVSSAVAPMSPSFPPRRLMIVMGALGGFVLGAFLALLAEQMDRSFRTEDEVEAATGLPVLAMVPRVKNPRNLIRRVIADPDSPYCQALRKLHTSLLFSRRNDPPPRVALVTSTMPKEGKSSLCLSLAVLLAQEGMKVVVLDCDWHRPNLHRLLRQRNRDGVAEILQQQTPQGGPDKQKLLQDQAKESKALTDAIYVDRRSGVHAIFAGDPRRLGRGTIRFERLSMLVAEMARRYDVVLIDGPPVLVGVEALYLSRIADTTLFAVQWGNTSHEEVSSALHQLGEARSEVAGVVLTQVHPRRYRLYGRGPLSYHYARPVAEA